MQSGLIFFLGLKSESPAKVVKCELSQNAIFLKIVGIGTFFRAVASIL